MLATQDFDFFSTSVGDLPRPDDGPATNESRLARLLARAAAIRIRRVVLTSGIFHLSEGGVVRADCGVVGVRFVAEALRTSTDVWRPLSPE